MTASREQTPNEPLSTRRELELLRELQRLASHRAGDESRIQAALAQGMEAATQARDVALAEVERRFVEGRTAAAEEFERNTTLARQHYESERNTAQQQYKGLRQGAEQELSRVRESARREQQNASWETLTVFDALKGRPREKFVATVERLKRHHQELAILERDANEIMHMRRQWREFPPPKPTASEHELPASAPASTCNGEPVSNQPVSGEPAGLPSDAQRGWKSLKKNSNSTATAEANHDDSSVEETIQHAAQQTAAVRQAAVELNGQVLPRLYEGGMPFGILFAAWVVAAPPCAWFLGWQNAWWVVVSLTIALIAGGGVLAWLWPIARRQSGRQFQLIQQQLAEARQTLRHSLQAARQRGEHEAHALVAERDERLTSVEKKVTALVGEREKWVEGQIGEAGQTFPQRLAQLREQLDRSLADAKNRHAATLAQVTECRDQRSESIRREFDQHVRQLRTDHEREWQALKARWESGLAEWNDSVASIRAQCDRLFPNWDRTDYESWLKPNKPSPAIQLGNMKLDLAKVKHGISADERLRPAQTTVELPALMTLEEHPVLLITAEEEGRRQAIELLQLAMLRMLTAMPPGKVRFTILDPVGLGENFASFMHLADYDELLIASRIWTDSRQIDEQLTRLTAHMETVLQKYLRNEFATIHEYNAQAGEVAEPFQVLVAANFPTSFSEAAARKLVSIATSGPRCGVYTFIMADRKQKLPANFDLKDLEAGAVHLDWVSTATVSPAADPFQDSLELPTVSDSPTPSATATGAPGFRWRYPTLERLPLKLDSPPSADRFNDVVRAAGRAAKDSMKVEVPFQQVAPESQDYWKGDSGKELVVPIGRAGARRLQAVRLGKGTSQHLLVAGKTGSGKSTFLHGLITNAALIYGPDQVEFYLIDFKKGVEFKTYATHHLPHARVIAIESEREFGLSVLERLDGELRRRGELFRAAGVQDLPDFRKARPEIPMPRVLFIVDEFQELFVEDDKLAQDSALLLDRLVRQGRAFGIHVLLGSQTLSGAYSLARSTMGQMAVRVALQCSEADAHLILSDERNEAARFLSRPGEAIYNDQNGLLAGNHPFQVVWLPESQRVDYLRRVEEKNAQTSQLATRNPQLASPPTIVFEGDQAADPANNVQFREVLELTSRSSLLAPRSSPQKAWLGAAVAIKEPTAATFGRHAGSNLLVVGPQEESALGVLTNAAIALALQSPFSRNALAERDPSAPHFSSLAPSPSIFVLDGTRPESPEADTWQRVAKAVPGRIEVATMRDTARVVGQLAAELTRREAEADEHAPPLYLIIFNGGRFRELRRGEDDFSFSMDRDKPSSPDKQWAELLKNGPAWGIHSLVWCDSYNNLTRILDRLTMREFEMRVAFQMSAADSSSLLDNPAAAKLRPHRGLFASEDLGTLEKFRPYGTPTDAWLMQAGQAIHEEHHDANG